MLQVASLDDLMATKVKVILQRAEAKDYRDIAAMLNVGQLGKRVVSRALALWRQLRPSESLKALVYFGDGDLHTLSSNEKTCLVAAATGLAICLRQRS